MRLNTPYISWLNVSKIRLNTLSWDWTYVRSDWIYISWVNISKVKLNIYIYMLTEYKWDWIQIRWKTEYKKDDLYE